jgi:hypothetical protein
MRSSPGLAKSHRCLSELTTVTFGIFLLLSCARAAICAQLTESQAGDSAKESVLSALGRNQPALFLSVKRDHALEELFTQVTDQRHGSMPFVFRISNEGEEHSGNTVRYHISSEGPLVFIVVVSDAGDVFQVKGVSDSQKQFNRLANRYHVNLQSDRQVQNYLSWYLAVNPTNFVINKVDSAAQLKEVANTKFRSIVGHEGDFEAWWQEQADTVSRLRFGDWVVRGNAGFTVRFYVLSEIDPKNVRRGPSVLHASVGFSTDGKVGKLTVKKI